MRTSVIISTFDKPHYLARTLAGMSAQLHQPTEVLIADAKKRVERNPTDLQWRYELGEQLVRAGQFTEVVLRPTGPAGADEEWTLFGIGLEALLAQYTELDPDWVPDPGPD